MKSILVSMLTVSNFRTSNFRNSIVGTTNYFIILISIGAFISGCTLSNGQLEDPGFRQRVTPAQQAVPLPVEIAKDIERISEDGVLVYSKNPTYSEALGVLSESVQGSVNPTDENPSNTNASSSDRSVATLINENDMVVKEEVGPLRSSFGKKKTGPLNFRSKISGSKLEPLTGGKTVSYVVKLGDTLMKIAFEKYANYLRWKDIYKINKNKMLSPEKMQVGTELTIKNVKYIYIKRDGQPYLIKKMDTLKSISQSLYGTPDRWQEIWKNNPELIRNPKKIYAGFTLYYPEKNKPKSIEQRLPTSNNSQKE